MKEKNLSTPKISRENPYMQVSAQEWRIVERAKGNMLQHKKANNIFQLIEAERTKHSKKPIEAIERIEFRMGWT